MKTCFLLLSVVAALGGLTSTAGAAPYWITYEGDRFPEEDGWAHHFGPAPGHRWIDDGMFVLDTMHDIHMVDYYAMNMGGELDPEPGETFVLEWRLLVEAATGEDVVVGVFADSRWAVCFQLDIDRLSSVFEHGVEATFAPGVFHEYRLTSDDMRTYSLYIDDAPVLEGDFWHSLWASRVDFGDGVQGFASRSRWDYVRFGVIPEPTTGLLFLLAACATVHARCRR